MHEVSKYFLFIYNVYMMMSTLEPVKIIPRHVFLSQYQFKF